MQENNRTEFKRELNDRFERAVVSFLNYAGGRVAGSVRITSADWECRSRVVLSASEVLRNL
jgi:hypothetical protein